MSPRKKNVHKLWTQAFNLKESRTGYWQIGSMELWIAHRQGCVEIYQLQGPESHLQTLAVELETERSIPSGVAAARVALPRGDASLRFAPLTADRPVVVRPRDPFYVLGQSETCLYLSTPLWLSIHTAPANRMLLEFPLYRLSDTWFGPSTRVGEFCYATRTRASLQPPQAPTPPHRAVTALTLINRSNEPILLERVNLPAPNLSLFQAEDDGLWTQSVRLDINETKGEASLHLESSPPQHVGRTALIGNARQRGATNLLKRALSALIS